MEWRAFDTLLNMQRIKSNIRVRNGVWHLCDCFAFSVPRSTPFPPSRLPAPRRGEGLEERVRERLARGVRVARPEPAVVEQGAVRAQPHLATDQRLRECRFIVWEDK